jgi:hypothetical protein
MVKRQQSGVESGKGQLYTMAWDGKEAAVQGWSRERASSHTLGSPPRSKSTYSTQLFTMAEVGEEAAVRGGVGKGPAPTRLALHLGQRVHTVHICSQWRGMVKRQQSGLESGKGQHTHAWLSTWFISNCTCTVSPILYITHTWLPFGGGGASSHTGATVPQTPAPTE